MSAKIRNPQGGGVDLQAIGTAWSKAAIAHRKKIGAFGKVQFAVYETSSDEELRLTEETTFKPSTRIGDPMEAALAWVKVQKRTRAENGSTGSIWIEAEDRNGRVVSAKVIEVTVIRRSALDTNSALSNDVGMTIASTG